MTKKKSLLLTLCMALVMCLCLGFSFSSNTMTAYAESGTLTPYDKIYLNNKALNDGWYLDEGYNQQRDDNPTSYVAKYKDGVLTLNNYTGQIVGTSANEAGCYTINLIGENVLTNTEGQKCVFLDSTNEGRITITSETSGTLTLTATSEYDVWAIGAGVSTGCENNDVVIEGNAKIKITATTSGENINAVGIYARNVTIKDNASVDVTAKTTNSNTEGNWTKGIFAHGKATINTNGNINIDVTNAGGDRAYSYGVYSVNDADYTKVGNMTVKWKKSGNAGSPILNGTFSSECHAINENSSECFASYRYGTPCYVNAVNGELIIGPGVPDYFNWSSGNFLAGDKITLNAPAQVSETETTNLSFVKWFSFASDVVIENAETHNGAILTVPNKDVEVCANYNAFTAQPVFERESNVKGTVTFTLISNNFNQSSWIKIRPINDLTISKGTVMRDKGTTYKATLEDNGTAYGTPAGKYAVEVIFNNGITLYSEPFIVDYAEKMATIGDVNVFGEKGSSLTSTDIIVTLTGYTFETTLSGNWITNLPTGLVQSVTRISDTVAKITVSGTPTALSDQVIEITIPKANITGLTNDLTAESNSGAKFNIVNPVKTIAVPTAKTGLTYTGLTITGVEEGEGYTLTDNTGFDTGNYTTIAKLKSGYKWDDGTITDKEISWSIGKRNPIVSDFNFYGPSDLKYDGNAKTARITLIASYYEVGYTITIKYKKGGVIVSEVKDAGEYEVYIDTNETGNFNAGTGIHDASWKFTIEKAEQLAPSASLFTTVAPTSTTATDGKIKGITAKMEYRKSGDSAWTLGTDSDITGLSSGTYQIRFKETDNYKAGAVAEVVVPECGVSSYNLTVTSGTGGGVFTEGTSVTITANTPAKGQRFTGWTIEGISGLDTTQTSITFNMPAGNVTATANYEYIEYTVTVTGGTADKSTAKYGETITITATIPTGKSFVEWTSESGSIFADKTSVTTTFTMLAEDVTVVAIFEDKSYSITVINGTKDKSPAKAGETITITADTAPEGKVFDKWTCETEGVTIEFASATSATTTFVMPASEIEIKAHFRDIETAPSVEIKVEGGTGAGTYREGDTVTITANAPAEGKRFKHWQDASGKILSTDATYTFNVTENLTLTAVYEDVQDYNKGLNGGAIAGIVIGSVAVAGIGGFAIYWFAISKKTFADLGTAFKKFFEKIKKLFKKKK